MSFSFALFHHPAEKGEAGRLRAALRAAIQPRPDVWTPASIDAFDDRFAQQARAIEEANAVLLLIGPAGLDDEFLNLTKTQVWSAIAARGRGVGRAVVRFGPAPAALPNELRGWPQVEAGQTFNEAADLLGRMMRLGLKGAAELRLADAKALLKEVGDHDLMPLTEKLARFVTSGKQLTLFMGPYCHIVDADDLSCPGRVRIALTSLIEDEELHPWLLPRPTEADLPPLIWQDHLATLCLGPGGEQSIEDRIDQTLKMIPGDESGPPQAFCVEMATLAANLLAYHASTQRSEGAPALTIISLSPSLCLERALVAAEVSFDRIVPSLPRGEPRSIVHELFVPTPEQAASARDGENDTLFMPNAGEKRANWSGVRLIKLGGSRDIVGMPSDVPRAAQTLAMGNELADSLAGISTGAYVALGGGLLTPTAQAVHAALLRPHISITQNLPRFAVLPPVGGSRDPFAGAEARRLAGVDRIPGSGYERLSIARGKSLSLIRALAASLAPE